LTRLYLLDTNTVSYIIKGVSPSARSRLVGLNSDEAACISSITEGELWFGFERIHANTQRRVTLEAFLGRIRILPWGREEAAIYGSFRAHQEAIGRSLGPLDTQIAAHAIAVGAILVSSDQAFRHARNLPGLETWAADI